MAQKEEAATNEKDAKNKPHEQEEEDLLPKAPQFKPKMFIAPVVLMGSKRLGIDFNDPETLKRIRFAFAVSVTMCYLVIFYKYKQVKLKEKKLSEEKC